MAESLQLVTYEVRSPMASIRELQAGIKAINKIIDRQRSVISRAEEIINDLTTERSMMIQDLAQLRIVHAVARRAEVFTNEHA